MKKLASLLIVLASVIWGNALAQTPTYMNLPAPKGNVNLDKALIAEAKALGYEGVVLGLGVDSIQDPLRTSTFDDLRTVAAYAIDNGLRVHLRLLQNVPRYIYQNGVKLGPTVWVTKYHARNPDGSPDVWSQPFCPPLDTCKWIAQLAWQPATDVLVDELKKAGRPLSWGSEELINEPCVGGAGGPYYGESFTTAVWPDYPQGTILPYTWKMLRTLRYSFSARGLKTFAATLEGDKSYGQTEVDCVVGEDAQRVSDGCSGWGFNRYASNPSNTPCAAADWWVGAEQLQVSRMRANSIIGDKPLFNTEFGMKPSLMKDLTDYSIADYRNAVMKTQRQMTNIVGAGYFCAYATNSLGANFNLFTNWPLQTVGGDVGPALTGA